MATRKQIEQCVFVGDYIYTVEVVKHKIESFQDKYLMADNKPFDYKDAGEKYWLLEGSAYKKLKEVLRHGV